MSKTELALASIFKICDDVGTKKRPLVRSKQDGRKAAAAWIGRVRYNKST